MLDPKSIVEKFSHRSYVYICYLNDQPVYVGKGTGKRYLHCTSGKSSNARLNKAVFEYGLDAMSVNFIYYNLDDWVALGLERDLIQSLVEKGFDLFNVDKRVVPYKAPEIWVDPEPLTFWSAPVE